VTVQNSRQQLRSTYHVGDLEGAGTTEGKCEDGLVNSDQKGATCRFNG
jgi:hypothetical protein